MEVVSVDPVRPDIKIIERACKYLEEGQLIVAPTETRYGLLGRADREDTLRKVYDAKGRSYSQPVAVFIRDAEMISDKAEITPAAKLLMDKFWPGPLTLVLKARQDWLTYPLNTEKTGFRCSSSPVIQALTDRVDFPLTATSANLSGQPEPVTLEEIRRDLDDAAVLGLDAGPLEGQPSTVVDVSGEKAVILRQGGVSSEVVHDVLRGGGIH